MMTQRQKDARFYLIISAVLFLGIVFVADYYMVTLLQRFWLAVTVIGIHLLTLSMKNLHDVYNSEKERVK